MDETRQLARKAAKLQLLADRYRQRAGADAARRRMLEIRARALEAIAATLLSSGSGVAGQSAFSN